jgi:hypothetical protein
MDKRLEQLTAWVEQGLGITGGHIAPASSDASFRRYFRITLPGRSYIVMDAPPDKEDCGPFIRISAAMARYGLNVPVVLEQDLAQGFLLLSDLGHEQYLSALNETSVDALYGDAISALVQLQAHGELNYELLPCYDHALLLREMRLFQEWFLEQHLQITLNAEQQRELNAVLEWLAQQALQQPYVWVHRDYHSRNLMVTPEHNPGVLDFQDAVIGPVSYDLVSLLKDCYIAWPRARVEMWVERYRQQAMAAGVDGGESLEQLLHWFDMMGVQRHLKVLGIFARLNIRDGKPGYLQDIPRIMDYVLEVVQRTPQLQALRRLLEDAVAPRLVG